MAQEPAGEVKEEAASFDALGLNEQLCRALRKKDGNITVPTPIQREAIPIILEGKDVVARAKTGSGKTLAYLLPLLQDLLSKISDGSIAKAAPNAFILVPTRELCQQVFNEASYLLKCCTKKLQIVQLVASMPVKSMGVALSGKPNILVTTPACLSTCLSKGFLQASAIKESLSMLILDEADLLLSFGYECDLHSLIPNIPRSCQCILMSATSSPDVEKLKKLLLHNPVTLTLTEAGSSEDEIVPKNVQQFWISCRAHDKLLYTLALLKLELAQKKVLIFVNTIDAAFQLRLFLEKFGIKSSVLNAELPQNSRLHIIEEFNAGLFDYLVAADDSKTKDESKTEGQPHSKKSRKRFRQKLDAEFGVVRGIDFKDVFTVVNFDMPQSPAGYVHRIGRTGRAFSSGTSISLVSQEEEKLFEEIKIMLRKDDADETEYIAPFPLLTRKAVESLRYRAQDVARSVTSRDIQEARRQDLKNEILNSEKLKAHFEENPTDLELLKHDKILTNKEIPKHLRDVPEYLVDPATKEASKMIKLSRAVMQTAVPRKRPGLRSKHGSKNKNGHVRDPLKSFSIGGKRSRKHGKGSDNGGTADGRKKKT